MKVEYVSICTELQPNFKIYSSVNLGIPYDYNSILHYSRWVLSESVFISLVIMFWTYINSFINEWATFDRTTFSENGQPTITANDDYDRALGGSVLSADDIRRVKALYECCKCWRDKYYLTCDNTCNVKICRYILNS